MLALKNEAFRARMGKMNDQNLFANRYKILSTLGSGGMGIVYHALDTVLNKEVALKTLRVGFSPDQIMRFQTEAKALSTLKHPHIVQVLVIDITEDNTPYLVMDFVEGKSLADLVESRGYIPAYKSVNIFIALCDGLAHVHRKGVLHRDLKPANIMLRYPDSLHPIPMVVDFGIARLESSSQSLTKAGSIVGTPMYMSPEQLKGKIADARSDVYSVGCIMYETLTGKRPFSGESELETLAMKLESAPPRLEESGIDVDFPEVIEAIVAKTLQLDPDKRYQSMAELQEALVGLKSGDLKVSQKTKRATEPSPSSGSKQISKRTLLKWSVGIITALLGSAVAIHVWLGFSETPTVKQDEIFPKSVLNSIENQKHHFSVEYKPEGCYVRIETAYGSDETDESILKELRKRKAKNIACLHIINQPITGSLFLHLKNEPLGAVKISAAKLNSNGLKALAQVKSIFKLSLEEMPELTSDDFLQLANLPELQQLSLMRCSVDLEDLKSLSLCKKITWLDIEREKAFDGRCLRYVASAYHNLVGLDIGSTRVKSEDFASLSTIPKLSQLKIQNLDLDDKSLRQIPDLPKLELLDIDDNKGITDVGLLQLLRFKNLNSIGIVDTSITPAGKAKFKKLRPTANIDDKHGRTNIHDIVHEE